MTTHLRARALQAGAFLALIGGVLVAAPSAALAIPPSVAVSGLSSGDIPSGGKTTLKYKVTNRNLDTPGADDGVTVVVSANGMQCTGACNLTDTIPVGQTKEFTATLTAGNVDPGQTKNIQVQITAKIGDESGNASRNVTVRGPDKPQTVRQVSGRVKDQDGKAVSGALVALRDSQNHTYNTTSNGDGGYSFTSSNNAPIAVGTLAVGATKDGYDIASVNAQGGAGKSVNVPLTIKLKATASPSASASASASTSATPTDENTETADPAADESAAALNQAPTSGQDSGSGSMLFIILGGLLVAAGIGAIVLVLMRRKSGDDADGDDGAGSPSGPVPAGAGGGRYGGADETRLAGAPVGGRAGDATMIAPRSGAPSMADAPTMIHQAAPPVDEFPDPYGAPVPQGGGYNAPGGWGTAGAAAGAYGAAQGGNAYGTATQYGGTPVPAQSGGYADQDVNGYGGNAYGAAPDAGYGDQDGYEQAPAGYGAQPAYEQPQQRYDEPTGMYRPEPNGGYPPDAGYGDQGGYGGAEPAYGPNGYGQGGDDYADQGRGGAYQGGNGYQGGAYGAAPGEPADQGGGYGSWDGPGGGIDNGNAYGPPAGGGSYGGGQGGGAYGGGGQAYGAPAGGGNYGAPAGAGYGGDQGGYDPRATYGRPEGYDQPGGGRGQQPPQAGYDQGGYGAGPDQGGYYGGPEQQGGRHGGQPRPPQPEATHPAQRRPIDWLDD